MNNKPPFLRVPAALVAAALLGLASLASAANIPDGSYEGTLSCGAGQATDIGPAFTAPTKITVNGSKLTWSRQTGSMKEVVSGSLLEGKAVLEGYGGSVSANTKQAFWDWRLKAQLTTSEKGVSGEAQIYSKDGSTLQRACKFSALVPGGATAETSIAPAPTKISPAAAVAEAPPAAANQPPAKVSEQVAPVSPQVEPATKEISQREAALKQKELELARREREAALRERELALRAKEKELATTRAVAEPAVAVPMPAPKPEVEVVSTPSPVVAAAPAMLPVAAQVESEAKVEVIPPPPQPIQVAQSRVEEPLAKPVSASSTATPQKTSGGTSDVLLTSAVIAVLLVLAAIGWNLYPRFFQSRSENYYSSPWQRLKKRSGFVVTFCFFSVMAIAAVVSVLRSA